MCIYYYIYTYTHTLKLIYICVNTFLQLHTSIATARLCSLSYQYHVRAATEEKRVSSPRVLSCAPWENVLDIENLPKKPRFAKCTSTVLPLSLYRESLRTGRAGYGENLRPDICLYTGFSLRVLIKLFGWVCCSFWKICGRFDGVMIFQSLWTYLRD